MDAQREIPIIYNLFPRLAGHMPKWLPHAARAAEMGFNWIYINSILHPGYSGSLYAVKHHYRINPLFLPRSSKKNGMAVLQQTLSELKAMGLWPMMDLVINHTSRDCPLVYEKPSWYLHGKHGEILSPFVRDVDDPRKITVWDDLAEIDNAGTSDREGLWAYWAELVRYYLRLGFKGFRCDAAYKVPAELWRYLVDVAAQVDREAVFFAETLGSTEEQTLALGGAGLHYFFNSSKWWDFEQPWCLEQHERFGAIAPSISFPESHDTARLAAETHGSEAVQRQRYAFAAVFSAGLMMPIGYEFGFKRDLDVVFTRPAHWEAPTFDIQKFIRRVNRLKLAHPLLHGEGNLKISKCDANILVLERRTEKAPDKVGLILLNKCCDKAVSLVLPEATALSPDQRLYRMCRDDSPWDGEPLIDNSITLSPAEVALILEPARVIHESPPLRGDVGEGITWGQALSHVPFDGSCRRLKTDN
jgi:starch synthase (maltosyl-transferring)